MINDVTHISLSGAYGAQKRLAVSANNIANVFSHDYKPQRVVQSSLENGGVQTTIQNIKPATIQVNDGYGGLETLPNIDITRELAQNRILAKNAYQFNLAMIKSQDQIYDQLLDITT